VVLTLQWSVQTHGELHNLASNHIKTLDDEVIDTDVDVSQVSLTEGERQQ
jgi:hypothetical protein